MNESLNGQWCVPHASVDISEYLKYSILTSGKDRAQTAYCAIFFTWQDMIATCGAGLGSLQSLLM